MKKMLKPISTLGIAVFSLLAGITLTGYTMAQEGDSVLVQKIDALVDSLNNLAKQNNSSTQPSTEATEESELSLQATSINKENPQCLDGYASWPSSNFLKVNADWSNNFMIPAANPTRKDGIQDLNGDGLNDWYYLYTTNGTIPNSTNGCYRYSAIDGAGNPLRAYNTTQSCVYLNNGSGWDPAYRCVATLKLINTTYDPISGPNSCGGQYTNYTYQIKYYGDCAQL